MVSAKQFIAVVLGVSGLTVVGARADSNANRTLSCTFTEPFYDVDLDLDTGRLTRTEYDWEDIDPNSDYVTRLLDEHAQVILTSTGSGVQIVAKKANSSRLYLDGKLNFKGSNGMSEHDYPVSIVHHWEGGRREEGGCTLGTLKAFERAAVDEDVKLFGEYSTQAIALCFARAVGDWTAVKSDFAPDSTKFYVLYRGDVVPGEPGEVSSTFSSAENEELAALLDHARSPATDAASMKTLRAGMWNYCSYYSQQLQTRYLPLEENHSSEEN